MNAFLFKVIKKTRSIFRQPNANDITFLKIRFNLEGIYIYIAYIKSILYTSENFNARNSKIKRRYLFDITCKFNLIFVLYFSDFNHKVLSSTTRCLAKGKYPKGKACILNLSINKYTTSTVGRLHIAYHKL